MQTPRSILLLFSLLAFSVGPVACQERNRSDANAFVLRTVDLRIGPAKLAAEVADTPDSRATGLMFRDSLPPDQGMLFVFEQPQQANFWMKSTKIPLSIGFLDSSGTLLEIRNMQPFDETPVTSRSERVAYALEVNQGWFDRNHVHLGTKAEGLHKR